jgi:hypothetical protein
MKKVRLLGVLALLTLALMTPGTPAYATAITADGTASVCEWPAGSEFIAAGDAEEYGLVTIPPLNASVQPQVFLPLLSR